MWIAETVLKALKLVATGKNAIANGISSGDCGNRPARIPAHIAANPHTHARIDSPTNRLTRQISRRHSPTVFVCRHRSSSERRRGLPPNIVRFLRCHCHDARLAATRWRLRTTAHHSGTSRNRFNLILPMCEIGTHPKVTMAMENAAASSVESNWKRPRNHFNLASLTTTVRDMYSW